MGRRPKYAAPTNQGRVFYRYPNRRYYSATEHHYVNVETLLMHRKLIVLDARTGKDITKWAVAAARLERGRKALEALAEKMDFQP